jgi:NMD protein affecting ribosome stability and mRNA decay
MIMICKCGNDVLCFINGVCPDCNAAETPRPRVSLKGMTPEQRKAHIKQRRHEEYVRNRAQYIARAKRWAKDNPEKATQSKQRYKAKIREMPR